MMADTLTPRERSERMARIRNKDTKPEMAVRRFAHGLGYRYRLHGRELPGRPDIVFRPRRKAIFVHGCFFHRHPGCKLARLPKSRLSFWQPKLESNRERDLRNQKELSKLGWQYMIIWECETTDSECLKRRIIDFMEDDV